MLLVFTIAPKPIAVALVKLSDPTFALFPIAVLSEPATLLESAPKPKAVLLEPVSFSARGL